MKSISQAVLLTLIAFAPVGMNLRRCIAQDAAAVIAVLGKCAIEVAGHDFGSKSENIILDLPWVPVPAPPVPPGNSPPPVDALVIDPAATRQDDPKYPHIAVPKKFSASSTIENKKATLSTLSADTSDKSGALAIAVPPHLRGHKSTFEVTIKVGKGDAIVYVVGSKSGRLAKSAKLKKNKDGKQTLIADLPKDEHLVFMVELSADSSVKVSGLTAVAK